MSTRSKATQGSNQTREVLESPAFTHGEHVKLNIYMGFSRNAGSGEGACLIFAHTAKEARKIAYRVMGDWFDNEWIDTAVRRLRKSPWLMLEADMIKLAEDKPHAIECPKTCPTCNQWGHEQIAGRCTNCGEVSNVELRGRAL